MIGVAETMQFNFCSITKLWSTKYGYHLAQRYAKFNKSRVERRFESTKRPPSANIIVSSRALDWTMAMLVGRASLSDAYRSIASFARYVGHPNRLLLATDGTLDPALAETAVRSAGLGCDIDFRIVQGSPLGLPMSADVASHPMIKKLVVMADLISPSGLPTLYVDSDIVFFPAAAKLDAELARASRPMYMLDSAPTFDPRLLIDAGEAASPANGGLLWFPRALNWDRARQRLFELGADFTPTHFTEQTAVHLAMQDSSGVPFDPSRFILSVADQFEWRDRFAAAPGVICRHYVSTIRHKMWVI